MKANSQHRSFPLRETTPRPEGVDDISASLNAQTDRLTLRLEEVARALGVSRRAIERERSAGRFPRPDVVVGRMPLWRPETIRDWLGRAGR